VARLERLHRYMNHATTQTILHLSDGLRGMSVKSGKNGLSLQDIAAFVKNGEKDAMNISQLESELAKARKDVQSATEELREAMICNVKILADMA
jgi:hypothetical protein